MFADIELRKKLSDKALMRKYNCSRSLLYTTWRKHKTSSGPKPVTKEPEPETAGPRYVRTNSRPYRELSPEQKAKANTRAHSKMLVKRGILKKGPCERCGTQEGVEIHHEDYSDPYLIKWLCRPCHVVLHEKTKTQIAVNAPLAELRIE